MASSFAKSGPRPSKLTLKGQFRKALFPIRKFAAARENFRTDGRRRYPKTGSKVGIFTFNLFPKLTLSQNDFRPNSNFISSRSWSHPKSAGPSGAGPDASAGFWLPGRRCALACANVPTGNTGFADLTGYCTKIIANFTGRHVLEVSVQTENLLLIFA